MPLAERSKPQIPIETRLIGRVNARRLTRILGLESKWIRRPVFAVLRTLKLDFIAPARHGSEQTVTVGNSKWFQRDDRESRQRCTRPKHPHQQRSAGAEKPSTHHAGQ